MAPKQTDGKIRLTLVDFKFIQEIAKVREYGTAKYGSDFSWRDNKPSDYKDSVLRHVYAYNSGEINDPESGIHHLAHAACNCMFLMALEEPPKTGIPLRCRGFQPGNEKCTPVQMSKPYCTCDWVTIMATDPTVNAKGETNGSTD